jgi:5-hmdU DNA kinase, helical domain
MLKKDLGLPKPWSDNVVFQHTYFCNVRREDDRVSKFIRGFYSPHVESPFLEYNLIFARFINWPSTLDDVGFLRTHSPASLENHLERLSHKGKVWGGAYVITTHGIPMGKAAYLCHNVLEGVFKAIGGHSWAFSRGPHATGAGSCAAAHKALQSFEGLGSFLAAQVVADLKNTPGYPLYNAPDRATFVAHGPGSLRGLQWFWGDSVTINPGNFLAYFRSMREYVDENWNQTLMGDPIDNQDLQNCLCEFDKFMRVTNGTGKSKRNYPGAA